MNYRTDTSTETELVGSWQNISLVYSYGNQNASVDIVLNCALKKRAEKFG